MPRRSSGRAGPRKRYTVDAFEGIDGLQDDAPELPENRRNDDSDSADDFEATAGAEIEQEVDEDEDDMSGVEGHGNREKLSDGGSDGGEFDLDDGISIADDFDEANDSVSTSKRLQSRPESGKQGVLYNRGAFDYLRLRGSKINKQLLFVGPDKEAWEAVKKSRDTWVREATLPITRQAHSTKGTGGYHHSFLVSEETRRLEAEESWRWYYPGGGRISFEQKQQLLEIDAEEARAYLLDEARSSRSCLLGSVGSPQLHTMGLHQSVSLDHGWGASQGTSRSRRNGFVLNLGARVKCVEWVPNRPRYAHASGATSQYMATAVAPSRPDTPPGTTSAFAPLPSYHASIQLWKFEATEEKALDTRHPPVLCSVLCTRWGDVRALKWCPAMVMFNGVPSEHLGLLAGIWGDGGLRVLDLDQPSDDSSPTYLRVATAALTAHPPATVFTALTWMSSTRLAVGTANGCVAIFDIAEALASTEASSNIRPFKYFSAASTYIVNMATALPSQPNLLFTTAADGYNRFTDMRHPNSSSYAGTIESARGRSTHGAIAWHELCQSAIIIDDNFALKCLPIRRFFQSIAIARAKSACTVCATSPHHPFILTGTADGEVFGTNPLIRLLNPREQAIFQIWFHHEWRRSTTTEVEAASRTDGETDEDDTAARIGACGLSRFVEGFKLEQVSRVYREETLTRKEHDRQNMHFHTIYEEGTAITALTWNPNKDYAGWAAAGMGDGLLRVEDLVPS